MKTILLIVLISVFGAVNAQNYRDDLKKGNAAYRDSSFEEASNYYKKAIEKKGDDFLSHYNHGNSLYQQQEWEEAARAFELSESLTTEKELKANALHNLGNANLQQQNYKDAIEAYKKALRLNPNDQETRYNLAQALRLMKNPPPKEDQEDSQDKNEEDENQDQNKQDKKDNQDGQDDDNAEGNDQEKNDKQDSANEGNNQEESNDENQTGENQKEGGEGKQDERPNAIPRQEAARLLDALDRDEQKLQEKLRLNEQNGKGKKTEKKW